MAKPASGTGLDTGHSLYTDLEAVYGLLEGTGSTSADSFGSNHLTLSGSGLWGSDGDGPILALTNNADNKPAELATRIGFNGTVSFSIAFGAKQTTSNTDGMVMGDPDSAEPYVWFNGGNYLRVKADNGANADFTSLTSFTTQADYLLVYEFIPSVSTLLYLYKDGTLTGDSPINIAVDFIIDSLGNGFNTGSGALALVGSLSYVYVWRGRALDATDASTLATDPYVIFAGGGGGGTGQPTMRRWGGVPHVGGQGIGSKGKGRMWGRTSDGVIVPRRLAA